MRALVIYDSTGRIWNIIYGEDTAPQGLTSMFVDIPDGATLNRIDVTEPENPVPVFDYLPDSDIGRLQKDVAELKEVNEVLAAELIDTQLALVEQYEENLALQDEVTNTQLALCEIYEGMEV